MTQLTLDKFRDVKLRVPEFLRHRQRGVAQRLGARTEEPETRPPLLRSLSRLVRRGYLTTKAITQSDSLVRQSIGTFWPRHEGESGRERSQASESRAPLRQALRAGCRARAWQHPRLR